MRPTGEASVRVYRFVFPCHRHIYGRLSNQIGHIQSDPIALQNEVQKSLILVQQSLVRQPGVPAAFADRMRHELVRIGQNSVQVMRLLNRERHEMQRSYQNAHETLSRLWNERNAAIQQRDAMGRELTSLRQELNAAREAEVRLRRQLEANQQEFARKYREIQKELSVKLAEIEVSLFHLFQCWVQQLLTGSASIRDQSTTGRRR